MFQMPAALDVGDGVPPEEVCVAEADCVAELDVPLVATANRLGHSGVTNTLP